MADQDPNRDPQDRNVELPGDTNSADIVGRTGEQMPLQSHDGLESEERERSTHVRTTTNTHVRIDRSAMSDRVVVHLPPMPQPKDFGLDAQVKNDTPAAERYDNALKVWERVVSDIAKRIGSKKRNS